MRSPRWAKGVFKAGDLERVSKAVRAAEAGTTGEFVVCVVRRSSNVGHAPYALALLIFCLLLMADAESASLAGYYGSFLPRWICEAGLAAVLGFALGQWGFVQRLFILEHERALLVQRRARLEFYQNGLEKTKRATGVLLFVSLLERQAVVLADKSIAAKVPEGIWKEVLEDILGGVKRGQLGDGLIEALQRSARIVKPHFPKRGRDKNELSDHLIIKE